MTNEEILEKQVEALEKLLQLKEAVIHELEAKVTRLQYPSYPQVGLGGAGSYIPSPYGQGIIYGGQGITVQPQYGGAGGSISIPSVWTTPTQTCTDGGLHQYPQLGTGSVPPCCVKCGQCSVLISSGATSGVITTTNAQGLAGTLTTTAYDGVSQAVVAPNNVYTLATTAK